MAPSGDALSSDSAGANTWSKTSSVYANIASAISLPLSLQALQRHSRLWDGTGPDRTEKVRFVDVAAGPGFFTRPLAMKLADSGRDFEIHCTDFAEGMVEAARKAVTTPGVSFEQMDGQDMSRFADTSVDGVNCMFGIMFMPEPQQCIREMKRVLKPGCLATVGTWATSEVVDLADAFGVFLGARAEGDESAGRRVMRVGGTREGLAEFFDTAGFAHVQVEQLPIETQQGDIPLVYQAIAENPLLGKSLAGGAPGARAPSLELFKEFLAHSPLSVPFRRPGGEEGVSMKFLCNFAVATC